MIQITLNSEQEQLLQKQLETGKYTTLDEVITEALKALVEKQAVSQPRQTITMQSGETAQKLLQEKIKMIEEIKKERSLNASRTTLAQEFHELCEKTQAIHAENPLTDEEIAAEIEAYRRGE